MGRGKAGKRGRRKKGKGLSENFEADTQGGEVTLGWEKGGIGLSVSFSSDTVKVSLGIGVAAVELDLGELNNSTVSYAFDLYEIEGARDGCTVMLTYRIAGQVTHTEVRKIPDCDEEKEQEKKEKGLPPEGEEPSDHKGAIEASLPGSPWDEGYWLLTMNANYRYAACAVQGLYLGNRLRGYSYYSGRITSLERNKESATTDWYRYRFREEFYQPHSFYPSMIYYEGYPQTTDRSGTYHSLLFHVNYAMRNFLSSRFYQSVSEANVAFLKGPNWKIKQWMKRHGMVQVEWEIPEPTFPVEGAPACSTYRFEYPEMTLQDYHITEKGPPTRKGINYNRGEKKQKRGDEDMDKKCCQMIAQIYKVLAVDEMLKEGFSAPNRLMMEGATGDYLASDYLKIIEFQVRMADHLGIHPIQPDFGDTNLLEAGKQEVATKTVNAHAAIKEILENSHKNNTGNEAILRVLTGFGIALAQLLRSVTEAVERLRGTMDFLGVPLRDKKFTVIMPFNIKALYKEKIVKKGQGEEAVEVKEKALNTEEKLETLLPKFIQNSEQTFLYEGYNDDEPNLMEELKQNDISNIPGVTEQ
ncbi:MAG: hypothetical protein WBA93_20130 [Microcoleaceae cyanobacterium]